MSCDCIDAVNKALTAKGATRLYVPIEMVWEHKDAQGNTVPTTMKADRVAVGTILDDLAKKRGEKPLSVIAAFCPFCGEAYDHNPAPKLDPRKEAAV